MLCGAFSPASLLYCLRQYQHKEVYDYNHSLIIIKKKLQAGKPDSVVGYHLSVLNITVGINLPTLYRVCLAASIGRAALNDSICGISACKVYPRIMLPL